MLLLISGHMQEAKNLAEKEIQAKTLTSNIQLVAELRHKQSSVRTFSKAFNIECNMI